jgi:DNA-binding transcriptional regulator YdaS (Cro superfamily)
MSLGNTISRPIDPTSVEGSFKTWGQLAAYLLDVKARRTWTIEANSFTEWVKQCAKRLSRTEASLWRCISSGRFYRARVIAFEKQGIALADLPQLPARVSSESLELLAKISRIAPPELIKDIELNALQGEIARGELRAIWETYRPVLKGRTARGRNAEAPSFDGRDPVQRDGRAEANSIMALRKAGPAWTGHPDATHYGVFPMDHPSTPARFRDIGLDAVIFVKSKNKDTAELHGVTHRSLNQMQHPFHAQFSKSIDRAWVITLGEGKPDLSPVPQGLGVLSTESGEVRVCREPISSENEPSITRDHLMRALLLRILAA